MPLIYDAHTLLASKLPFYHPKLSRRLKSAIGGFLDRRLPRRADHIIAVSEEIRQALTAHAKGGAPEISVIRNGVEIAHFASFDEALPMAPAAPVLAFAGNLAAYQGLELLLRAFRRVIDRHPRAKLRLLTDSDFGPYEALARELGVRHERTELIVPDGDIAGLAAAVCRILDEPEWAATLGAAAQRVVAAQYSWSHVAGRVNEIYLRLMACKRMVTA